MRTLALLAVVVVGILDGAVASPEPRPSQSITIGTGPGEVGVVASPNEQCRGPVTVTADDSGNLAILDDVNSKIVLLDQGEARDIDLPHDLAELLDIVVTDKGFVVVDALGNVAAVNRDGAMIARSATPVNPEAGTLRFTTSAGNQLFIENIRGDRMPAGLMPQQVGIPIDSTGSTDFGGTYAITGRNTGQVTMSSSAVSGQLDVLPIFRPLIS